MPPTTAKATLALVLLIAPLRSDLFAAGTDCLRWLVPRTAERMAQHADPVIQGALLVLGQAMNPIRVLDIAEIRVIYARTPGARFPPAGLNGFRLVGDPNIYINGESAVYQSAARKPSAFAMIRLAATLLHEQVHDSEGEVAAVRVQSDFVRSRISSMPRGERDQIDRYWRILEARAVLLARAENQFRR